MTRRGFFLTLAAFPAAVRRVATPLPVYYGAGSTAAAVMRKLGPGSYAVKLYLNSLYGKFGR